MAKVFEFLLTADDVHFSALVADPDRQRRAPVTLPRKPPVDDVFEEVPHAPVLDGIGHPVDRLVAGEQPVLDRRDLDEPAGTRIVQKRRIAAPAEGVGVFVHHLLHQPAVGFHIFYDQLVGVLTEYPRVSAAVFRHAAAVVHQLDERQFVSSADLGVVFTERGRDVHDARAVGQCNVVGVSDVIGFLFESPLRKREKRKIFFALVVLALFGGKHFIIFEKRGNERVRHDVTRAVGFDFGIVLLRIHAQRDVGRKRPGRGRPREEVFILVFRLKAHENRLFLDVLIPLRHFVAGKRRAAARAVRDDLMSLI